MRCALASLGCIDENKMFNKQVVIDTISKYSEDVDILILGEAFLQEFCISTGFKKLEVFPDLWDACNPCQIYIMSI